jgi:hypothetical protein
VKHLALPTYTILEGSATETRTPSEQQPHTESYWILAALTVSASITLAIYTASTTFALGLSSVIFAATGLVLFESTIRTATEEGEGSKRGLASANGTISRRASMSGAQKEQRLATLRDVALAITVMCGIASILMESSLTASTISWEPVYREYNREWRDVHNYRILLQFLWMIPVNTMLNVLTFIMVRTEHPFTSFVFPRVTSSSSRSRVSILSF